MSDTSTRPDGDPSAAVVTKAGGALVLLAGLGLVALVLVPSLFRRSASLEGLTDSLRPAMTDETIAAVRSDLAGLDAAAQELSAGLPAMVAQAQGVSVEDAGHVLATEFPDTVNGLAAVPQVVEQFGGLADLLAAEQERFAATDDIPSGSLPAQTIPWALLGGGFVLVLASAWILRGGSPVPALAMGGAVVVVGLALSLPSKSSHADSLSANVAPVFTDETVAAGQRAMATVGAMATELQTEALPAVGEMLGIPPEGINDAIAAEFPAGAAALATLPESSERLGGLVSTIEANLDNYQDLEPVDLSTIVNLALIAGAVAALAALGLMVNGRR